MQIVIVTKIELDMCALDLYELVMWYLFIQYLSLTNKFVSSFVVSYHLFRSEGEIRFSDLI